MKAIRSKIVVAEQNTTVRTQICTWLMQEGYAVFEAKDPYKTIRLARQVLPDLILLDVALRGINTTQMVHIIEVDHLSKVVPMTDSVNDDFRHLLSQTMLGRYVQKPLDRNHFLTVIATALSQIREEKKISAIREREKKDMPKDDVIQRAKAILMAKWQLSEEQAYQYMRKKSMDHSVKIDAIARAVLKKYSGKS
ncbi:ANTAR domain-containing response regulator [Fusibacter ferrireducens]|uniref:Stage 0 sporulation protein A homolog n=1 Tax=Fusibacter ferrireducens TaxID=2785058 RepID=A0ABR9ZPJ2_9FIRM|nr:ANTAR domain-containing protein [Fusibacter ferrireducens]MBF4692390.1 ANTAR domain-containing protein [Fusibacter ferrireducens]